jgi:hypothetical protein
MFLGPADFREPLAEKQYINVWIRSNNIFPKICIFFRYREKKQAGNEVEVMLIVCVKNIFFFFGLYRFSKRFSLVL